ncbi:hypothetical protein [Nocardiopsis sp. NRRL B-16309]|uniref:hypothetical protein n=1 Tax=Nocardiopsis sp. NRRL B-16309 TaxID=1519494 RepID=UPI000A60CF4D|nr:hypothetical protein [Nocardiopsis sp. NRRL B-16309]
MSERSAGGDLGRSLTGAFDEFDTDDTVRLRAKVWTAFALCVFVLGASALLVLLVA